MGREKDRRIAEEERGWYSRTRKLVCTSCVRDEYLSAQIDRDGKAVACGYCRLTPDEADVRCIPFDDLMDLIGDGILSAYTDADSESIPYESAEGGYAFPNSMFDTYDLVVDEIGLDVDEAVLKDVLGALPQQTWCRSDFWSLTLNGALRTGWEEFVEKVKYQTRYLFTLPERSSSETDTAVASVNEELHDPEGESNNEDWIVQPIGDPGFGIVYDRQGGIPVYGMLDAIGHLVRRLGLTRKLEEDAIILRARVKDKGTTLAGPGDLGPPKREDATQPNRMSPSGIVMFYGAMDRSTTLVETFQPSREGAENRNVWVARFRVMKNLNVLDLTTLPPIPSLYDQGFRDLRDGIMFLHDFVDDLVQPIDRDGREHIDYVPTQVVTEYMRHRFRTEDGMSLNGIFYKSAKSSGGTACVLFLDGTNCGAPAERWERPEQILCLLEDRTEVLDGANAAHWFPRI